MQCAHQARAGHVGSRGGKSGLSNNPIFPQPLCLSLIKPLSEEPEAHARGAHLLLLLLAVLLAVLEFENGSGEEELFVFVWQRGDFWLV